MTFDMKAETFLVQTTHANSLTNHAIETGKALGNLILSVPSFDANKGAYMREIDE